MPPPATLCAAALLLLSFPAFSQSAPADTAGYVKGGYQRPTDTFYLGMLTETDGVPLRVYLPSQRMGYERIVDYYEAPPAPKSEARRASIKIQEVNSMEVHGRYYENLGRNGKPGDFLALRMLDGPMEVFTFAEPKYLPVPLPLPGMPVTLINAYTNNHWYLRYNGEVLQVRRNQFASQMNLWLSSYPALARQVAGDEENYRYDNLVTIIREFNEYLQPSK